MAVETVRMRSLMVCLALVAGCTKPNPNRCCTDEADCTANDIPVGSTCDDGLLCRGHQCISIPCNASTECDAAAPYCRDGSCVEACDDDTQCPGSGGTGTYCVAETCVACRDAGDCSAATPVCELGTCRVCDAHSECASGACKADGFCATESEVAYVEVTGAATTECSKLAPCDSPTRALQTPREFIVIGAGTYAATTALAVTGKRTFIGASAIAPTLTRTTTGPIVAVSENGVATLEHLTVMGATSSNSDGTGIECTTNSGTPSVTLTDVTVTDNAGYGVFSQSCSITISRSRLVRNGFSGANIADGNATIDRSVIAENQFGLSLDFGVFVVTNNFIVRNHSATSPSYGISLYATATGHRIEFNTIADNSDNTGTTVGGGFRCDNQSGTALSFANNIIVRNIRQTTGMNCTYPGSVITDENIAPLNFKSPDAAPYDYHVQTGSIAIDMATLSTLDYDFDGEARPQGMHRDVGADEFVP